MTSPHSPLCAYCNERRAVNRDHVVPKYLKQRLPEDFPTELLLTVPACFECNIRKGTRKLIPASWEHHIPLLKAYIPGPWRTWDGDPKSAAYTAVHL